jgi:hypothetical protein
MQGRSRGRFAVPPCLAAPRHGPLIRRQPRRVVPGTRGPANGGQPGQASGGDPLGGAFATPLVARFTCRLGRELPRDSTEGGFQSVTPVPWRPRPAYSLRHGLCGASIAQRGRGGQEGCERASGTIERKGGNEIKDRPRAACWRFSTLARAASIVGSSLRTSLRTP